jgi:hypothetical protein
VEVRLPDELPPTASAAHEMHHPACAQAAASKPDVATWLHPLPFIMIYFLAPSLPLRRGQTNSAFKKRWFVLTPQGDAFYYKSYAAHNATPASTSL